MSEYELGQALAAGRNARGLTLLDVERDTRISSKYLKALEEGELEVLPAPVYARAFTRTYAQYLGLNAPALVQALPGARSGAAPPDLPPLPQAGRDLRTPLGSASWMIGAAVVVVLLVVGLVMFWTRGGDDGTATVSNEPIASEGAEVVGAGPAPDVEAGVVPALENEHVLVAVNSVVDAGLRYMVIEIENAEVLPEQVFSQTPTAGTQAEDDTVVTLLVSR